jgi:DNA-binding Lrp family transcriptional regulator
LGKIDEQIVALLQKSGKPMTLAEIADELGKPPKAVFKALQKLFSEGKINSDVKTRTYTLAKE